ncbi:MAG: hypothetical protein AAGM38_11445 [Pseudomonadota bacterium]
MSFDRGRAAAALGLSLSAFDRCIADTSSPLKAARRWTAADIGAAKAWLDAADERVKAAAQRSVKRMTTLAERAASAAERSRAPTANWLTLGVTPLSAPAGFAAMINQSLAMLSWAASPMRFAPPQVIQALRALTAPRLASFVAPAPLRVGLTPADRMLRPRRRVTVTDPAREQRKLFALSVAPYA